MNPTLLNPSIPTTNRRAAVAGSALLVSLLLAACATIAPVAEPQVLVRDRATARWQALLARDFAKAYTFTTPTVKKNMTEQAYKDQFVSSQWLDAEVVGVTCAQPAICVARVRLEVKVILPRTSMNKITTHFDETWLLEDGQWGLSE